MEVKRALRDFAEVVTLARSLGPDLRLVGIDGLPVAGKSTLATEVAEALSGTTLHLDDFVRPEPEWPHPLRSGFPFPYIRYADFLGAVLALAACGKCCFHPYDWATGRTSVVEREVRLVGNGPVVVEGVSALHSSLAPLYRLRVWVESDAATTLAAAFARGGGVWAQEWEEVFLPSVALYLETNPQSRADVLVAGRGITGCEAD